MKKLIAGFLAIVIGIFTLTFAAVFALFMGAALMIAKPFIKHKLATSGVQFEQKDFSEGFAGHDKKMGGVFRQQSQESHNVIDGECEEISSRKF